MPAPPKTPRPIATASCVPHARRAQEDRRETPAQSSSSCTGSKQPLTAELARLYDVDSIRAQAEGPFQATLRWTVNGSAIAQMGSKPPSGYQETTSIQGNRFARRPCLVRRTVNFQQAGRCRLFRLGGASGKRELRDLGRRAQRFWRYWSPEARARQHPAIYSPAATWPARLAASICTSLPMIIHEGASHSRSTSFRQGLRGAAPGSQAWTRRAARGCLPVWVGYTRDADGRPQADRSR